MWGLAGGRLAGGLAGVGDSEAGGVGWGERGGEGAAGGDMAAMELPMAAAMWEEGAAMEEAV